jgi:hypothetical protein
VQQRRHDGTKRTLCVYIKNKRVATALQLCRGLLTPTLGARFSPRAVDSNLHWESLSSMSSGCPHLKRARWSSLRPGVFLLWYVSFSNFQLALVVSDKGEISAREFLAPMRSAQTHTHLFRLARSS